VDETVQLLLKDAALMRNTQSMHNASNGHISASQVAF